MKGIRKSVLRRLLFSGRSEDPANVETPIPVTDESIQAGKSDDMSHASEISNSTPFGAPGTPDSNSISGPVVRQRNNSTDSFQSVNSAGANSIGANSAGNVSKGSSKGSNSISSKSSKRASWFSLNAPVEEPVVDLTPLRAELATKQEAVQAATDEFRNLQAQIQSQTIQLNSLKQEIANGEALKAELEAMKKKYDEQKKSEKGHPLTLKAKQLMVEKNAITTSIEGLKEHIRITEDSLTRMDEDKAIVRRMFTTMQSEANAKKKALGLLPGIIEYDGVMEEEVEDGEPNILSDIICM